MGSRIKLYTTGLSGADINGDGQPDIIATGYKSNNVVWHNFDQQTWDKNIIDEFLRGPRLVLVMDINFDNLEDIFVAAEDEVVCYEQVM